MTAEEMERSGMVSLWDAVNGYAEACGGQTGRTRMEARMRAVPAVTDAVEEVVRRALSAANARLARLKEAGGTLAHLLQHCQMTVAAERRAGIARWAEALAGGPEPAQGEAQPEAEAARPGHTIPLRLPDVPRPRTGGAGCAGAGYEDED